jgi:hypothetical protein
MSLVDLASLGTFISSIAVLVSLIFVMMQIRQSTRNQRATLHHERMAAVQELTILGAQADLAGISIKGSAGDDGMTDVEIRQFNVIALCTLRIMEELFYQHRDGMIDTTRWATSKRRLRSFLTAPGMRASWRSFAEAFEPDFRAFVDGLMAEVGVAPDANANITAWKIFAKEERSRAKPTQAAGDGDGEMKIADGSVSR